MSAANDEFELEYYTKIINFFKSQPSNKESVEIWKNKSFIELMKVLERTKNKELVQNAIILIISLFGQLPPDLYNNRGINANFISKKDKKSYLSLLKSEFMDEMPN
ncbi:MAG: hypothetical protein ACFE8M_03495 [Candidatus Hermodarchaeota archaeon]